MERDLSGRCGTCAFFLCLQRDDTGLGTGECRLGCWPSPLKENATCSHHKAIGSDWRDFARQQAKRQRGRNDPAAPVPRSYPKEIDLDMDIDQFRQVLRDVLQEELGTSDVALADRWRGGELVLTPGKADTQEKRLPLEQLFHKIVMIREKLRVLEQKINTHPQLDDADKVQMQQYVTACYGTLTTFNILFRDRDDAFVGAQKPSPTRM